MNNLLDNIDLREMLLSMRELNLSWSKIVDELYPDDENKSQLRPILYRIAYKKYNPRNNKLRARLNLVRGYYVYACQKCGIVHTGACPVIETVKPLPTSHAPRARRAISLDNPASAAATIRAHMAPEAIVRLVELLEQ